MSEIPSKANILYLDDEIDNLTVFRVAFRRYYEIYTAQTAAQAFEILQTRDIHVVITDQRMPEISGVEFLAQIPDEPYITRIILTAYTEASALIDAVNLGQIHRYINKPWKLDDFKQTIDNAIQNQHLIRTNKLLLGELKLSNIQLEEVNQQLVEKNKQLLALDKAKSEFLNIISHEIKTPLNGIVGLTRLLASQIEGEKYRKYFQALKISVDRLEEFAQNAIFLTELETQSYKCSKHNVMLRDIIQDAIHELRNKLKESKIEIEITTNPKNISLYTDQNLLRRSLTVLIDNAIRFSPDGSKIKIEGNRTNDLVALSVSDKGPGFSEQAISLMFKHFGIGEAHYDQHIGLGLSLVKLSMNLIGGEIEVSSTVGGGAIVTMSFQA